MGRPGLMIAQILIVICVLAGMVIALIKLL
jgi:hypothetical protein